MKLLKSAFLMLIVKITRGFVKLFVFGDDSLKKFIKVLVVFLVILVRLLMTPFLIIILKLQNH